MKDSKPLLDIFKSKDSSTVDSSKTMVDIPKQTSTDDSNKINFANLKELKFEKCDLKSSSSNLKMIPTKVVNNTPRPFSRCEVDTTDYSKPVAINDYETVENNTNQMSTKSKIVELQKPAVFVKKEASDIVNKSKSMEIVIKPNETLVVENKTVSSKGSELTEKVKKVTIKSTLKKAEVNEVKIVDPPILEKAIEEDKVKEESKADKKIKKFMKASALQKKTEKTEDLKPANELKDSGAITKLTSLPPDTVNDNKQKESPEKSGKQENRLSVRFKELKEKTVSEVNKMARGRSVQRGVPIQSENGEKARPRSESRSQKAGRVVKDFTNTILNKRR